MQTNKTLEKNCLCGARHENCVIPFADNLFNQDSLPSPMKEALEILPLPTGRFHAEILRWKIESITHQHLSGF